MTTERAKVLDNGRIECSFERLYVALGAARNVAAESDGKVRAEWKGAFTRGSETIRYNVYDYKSDVPPQQNREWSVTTDYMPALVDFLNRDEIQDAVEAEESDGWHEPPDLGQMLLAQWKKTGLADKEEFGDLAIRKARLGRWILVAYEADERVEGSICVFGERSRLLMHRVDVVEFDLAGNTAASLLAPGEHRRRSEAEAARMREQSGSDH